MYLFGTKTCIYNTFSVLLYIVIDIINSNNMDADRKFKEKVMPYLEGTIKCGGIILPNPFTMDIKDCNKIIDRRGNKVTSIIKHLVREYCTIGKDLLESLIKEKSYFTHVLVSYIASRIKFNSNTIKIDVKTLEEFYQIKVDTRTYVNSINFLIRKQVIKKTTIRGYYVVSPTCIFKGSIYDFIYVCMNNGFFAQNTNEEGKLEVDKVGIINYDKQTNKILNTDIIINKKYYKDELGFDFNKKIKRNKSIKDKENEIEELLNKETNVDISKGI